MSREAYRTLIFDRLELEILLNLSGCRRLYGFFGEADRRATKEQVYLAVTALFERGCLTYNQGKTRVSQEIKILLENMSNTILFLKIMQSTAKQPEHICYFTKEKVIVSFCSVLRENTVTLVEMEREKFFDQFITDFLPDISEEEERNPENILKDDAYMFLYETLLECEIWKNGKRCCRLCLMEYMHGLYILIENENQRTERRYEPKVFQTVLREMISEE